MTADPTAIGPVIHPQWLADHLDRPGLRIIDCTTWMHPNPVGASTMTSARPHWAQGHLPGSLHWDLVGDYSCQESSWPFTRPRPEALAKLLGRSGIRPQDHLVLYGARHPNIVTRAWWVLHSMGLERLSILDGGLEQWQALRLPLDTQVRHWPSTRWQADTFTASAAAGLEDVQRALTGEAVLVNGLSPAQFSGDPASTHYGRPGHIPGSLSLPAAALHDGGRFLPVEALRSTALAAGVPADPDTPLITYCGGGLAASMVYFCLRLAGWTNLRLYDNSLLEWSSRPELPMQCSSAGTGIA